MQETPSNVSCRKNGARPFAGVPKECRNVTATYIEIGIRINVLQRANNCCEFLASYMVLFFQSDI